MAEPISIQQLKDASEDAITLADFIYKPANVMIPRRLAADINSLQYYLDYMSSYAQHSYETYDEMFANAVNLPSGVSAFVTNDLDTAKNGIYTYNGTSFVKGEYQPEKSAKDYVEAKLGGLQVFDGKVRAQDVSTADGNTQAEVNKKTVYEYDTVATMLADTTISTGKVVSTNGYYSKRDGGGAKYEISSTATNYSIPLANGLHAIFSDDFDIRKFGIVNSKTKDQDTELARMRNYADTREYVIDFHNFWIRAPKEAYPYLDTGTIYNIARGLWFEYAHKYKNLKITHDKTVRLVTGDNLLMFCPRYNPDVETWVVFENITLDAWNDDNQPFTENYNGFYDGQRHGIYCHPRHKGLGGEIGSWSDQTNFSFAFKNINFPTPAYSYNITTSALAARRITIDGMYGEFVALGINYQALDLDVRNVLMKRRVDYHEAGRLLVGTVIHHEPELGNMSRDFNRVYLENIKGHRSDGQPLTIFKFSPIGISQTLAELKIVDCDGQIVLEGDTTTYDKVTRIGGNRVTNVLYFTKVNTLNLEGFTVTNWSPSEFGAAAGTVFGSTHVGTVNIKRCDIIADLFGDYAAGSGITTLNITDSTVTGDADYARLISNPLVVVNNINIKNVTTKCKQLLNCTASIINIDGLTVSGGAYDEVGNFIVCPTGGFTNITCYDLKLNIAQKAATTFFSGDMSVKIHGCTEVKSKITASSTSPYHEFLKTGVVSTLYKNTLNIGATDVAVGGSVRHSFVGVVDPNMKSYAVKLQYFTDDFRVTTTVVGSTVHVDLINTTTGVVSTGGNVLILTQTI